MCQLLTRQTDFDQVLSSPVNAPYNYDRTFSVSLLWRYGYGIHITATEPSIRVWRTALKGIHTLYTSVPDASGLGLPRLRQNINHDSWTLKIAYGLTIDCELIAPHHSLTTPMFSINPTPTQTTFVTGRQPNWDFKAYIKADKFVENESVNRWCQESSGWQVGLLVRILTSELA